MDPFRILRFIHSARPSEDTQTIADVPPTRVLLVDMPRMLRDIVGAIVTGQPDLEVVGEVDSSEALVACAERTQPHVLIVGSEPSVLTTSRRLMADASRLRVIEVVAEGRAGYLYQRLPERTLVGDISPEALLSVVRGP